METGTLMISASRPWDDGFRHRADDPYDDFAAEIVIQAVKDYTGLLRKIWRNRSDSKRQQEFIIEMMEIEEFFHSDWFSALCDYDPDKVIWNCRHRAREQEEEAIRKKNRRMAKEAVKKMHAIELVTEQNKDNQEDITL